MQRTLSTNTYQFHFFVLPMIFMPNPTVSYLCSQLASVTKGLCKQLLQANRFLPTSEETASYAVPICPPGMHSMHVSLFHFFFFFLLVLTLHLREEWKGKRGVNWRQNKTSIKPEGLTTVCMGTPKLYLLAPVFVQGTINVCTFRFRCCVFS